MFDLGPSPEPPPLPDSPFERARLLRNGLMGRATGGSMDGGTYTMLRGEFMRDGSVAALLPDFVRTCLEPDDFWEFIKAEFDTYKERRDYIRAQFAPMIARLEHPEAPPAGLIDEVLSAFDAEGVHAAWRKAVSRADTDPAGAVTAARTLLESVCLHMLGEDESAPEGAQRDDLPKLYRRTADALNLAPSMHSEQVFKQVLGGCVTVVEGLGALRNKLGDAHGKGKLPARVAPRHAHLVVNLAGAMALFLVETVSARAATHKTG